MGARTDKPSGTPDPVGEKPVSKHEKARVTDLGIIYVETRGLRDVVYLTHNHLRAFAVECFEDRPSEMMFSRKFSEYSDPQWREVFNAYMPWKRATCPFFKLRFGTGRKKDGSIHPWRAGVTNRPKPINSPTGLK